MKISLRTKGYAISGEVHLYDYSLRISADVPFAGSLFWGRIESMMRAKLGELLG